MRRVSWCFNLLMLTLQSSLIRVKVGRARRNTTTHVLLNQNMETNSMLTSCCGIKIEKLKWFLTKHSWCIVAGCHSVILILYFFIFVSRFTLDRFFLSRWRLCALLMEPPGLTRLQEDSNRSTSGYCVTLQNASFRKMSHWLQDFLDFAHLLQRHNICEEDHVRFGPSRLSRLPKTSVKPQLNHTSAPCALESRSQSAWQASDGSNNHPQMEHTKVTVTPRLISNFTSPLFDLIPQKSPIFKATVHFIRKNIQMKT